MKAIAKVIRQGNKIRIKSETYNSIFEKDTGFFARWGKTTDDDPDFCPFGPEIADIEITSGVCSGGCEFCYKGNGTAKDVEYMNLKTFETLFNKIKSPVLQQIAFGITDIHSNPDFWNIMHYAKENGVVPNYTTNGLQVDDEVARRTKELCGAVAVSCYRHNKETAYNAISKYVAAGMTQVNIHFMLSMETYEFAFEVLRDIERGEVPGLNAIVFLQYKDKNPDAKYHSVSMEQFKSIVDFCLEDEINFGFDSCSSSMFMKSVADKPNASDLIMHADNCESSLFSSYFNVNGEFFPCSFLEGVGDWATGINALEVKNFLQDVWFNPRTAVYRERLIASSKGCSCKFSGSCRSCFVYDINKCK